VEEFIQTVLRWESFCIFLHFLAMPVQHQLPRGNKAGVRNRESKKGCNLCSTLYRVCGVNPWDCQDM
jgi:hypothetical protein